MSIHPLRVPRDAVDTAQQFHLECVNARRYCARCRLSHLVVRIDPDGTCRSCKRGSRVAAVVFSRSRARRARIMDGLAVALLMLFMAVFGCLMLLWATPAKAETPAEAYAALYGWAVCETLADGHDSVAGITGIGDGIVEHSGLSTFEAGEVLAYSVYGQCPQYVPALKRFIAFKSVIDA